MQKDPFSIRPHTKEELFIWFNVISPNLALIEKILVQLHSEPVGGHIGFQKTIARIKSSILYPNVRQINSQDVHTIMWYMSMLQNRLYTTCRLVCSPYQSSSDMDERINELY